MANPFPGMNPYLEQPEFWADIQAQTIATSALSLAPHLIPKYRVITEVQIPVAEEIQQSFLEVRDAATKEVVTAIELLSPANKRGEGRQKYETKRQAILESRTHLIEIDLLREGEPLPMDITTTSHYRMLISRSTTRPTADLYAFNLGDRIPNIPIPLLPEDPEPLLDLQTILNELYDQLGYSYFIDYGKNPPDPWTLDDVAPFLP
jgi:hypothetical protein